MAKRKKFTEKAKVKLLKAFQASGVSAREFCEQRGVAASSFSAWRNRLAPNVEIESAGKTIVRKEAAIDKHLDFVPVTLVEAKPPASMTREIAQIEPAGAVAFEMLLPSGSIVRFALNCPPSFVAAAFTAIVVQ